MFPARNPPLPLMGNARGRTVPRDTVVDSPHCTLCRLGLQLDLCALSRGLLASLLASSSSLSQWSLSRWQFSQLCLNVGSLSNLSAIV